MTPAAQQDLYTLCSRLWPKVRIRLSKVKLLSHQWDDLRAIAIERVFTNLSRFDAAKGMIPPWAFVVMWRCTQNELRKVLPNKLRKDHVYRTNLLLARRLAITVRETGRWGEDIVVIEPDILDDRRAGCRDPIELDEFAASLTGKERVVWDLAAAGGTVTAVQRRYKLTRCYAERLIRQVRARYAAYQATGELLKTVEVASQPLGLGIPRSRRRHPCRSSRLTSGDWQR